MQSTDPGKLYEAKSSREVCMDIPGKGTQNRYCRWTEGGGMGIGMIWWRMERWMEKVWEKINEKLSIQGAMWKPTIVETSQNVGE